MTMRAVLERNAAAGKDAYGGALAPAWQPLATVPCWAWRARQGKRSSLIADGRKVAFLRELRCAFPADADVTHLDRVARIDDRLGAEIFAGPLAILSLEKRRGHLEAMLERVA